MNTDFNKGEDIMKKTIAFVASLLIAGSAMGMTAFAEENDKVSSVKTYVTIADKEKNTPLVQKEVTVTDIDEDGKLTINDALYIAHEENFEGGAEAGYKTATTEYGLTLKVLWGTDNGNGYGYYVNNKSAWSLADEVTDGDYINAFIYSDTANWSDAYTFFDVNTAEAKQGDELTFTLSKAGFDADYNPVTLPVEGAVITVNGEPTEFVTDSEGKVTVKLENAGEAVISATSDKENIVPPICVAAVAENPEYTTTTTTTTATETTTTTADSTTTTTAVTTTTTAKTTTATTTTTAKSDSPKTGDLGAGVAAAGFAVFAAVTLFTLRRDED